MTNLGTGLATLDKYRGSESILLVDDEKVVLSVASSVLTHCGYKVYGFDNPQEALRAGSGVRFDLVLTDVMMPGITGPQLVKEIHSSHPDIPCIFMSGYDPDQIAQTGVGDGCDYLRKPFTPEGLVKRIRRTLAEHEE